MATVSVVRVQRRKIVSDKTSPLVFSLKQKSGDAKVYDLERLAGEIETIGALSAEDVQHVLKSFVRAMKTVLRDGNRVKVDGLGTFYITLRCPGVATEKECTVRNIERVNLRFRVDNTLRLANDSTATTRSAPNNIQFALVDAVEASATPAPTPVDPAPAPVDPAPVPIEPEG